MSLPFKKFLGCACLSASLLFWPGYSACAAETDAEAGQPVQNAGAFNPYDATALDSILAYAARGQADFQHAAGVIYRYTLEDFPQAIHWFEQAGKQGHALSNYELAVMYEKGIHVDKSFEKALSYYSKAAIAGYDKAQIRAAFLLDSGQGTERNYKAAFEFIKGAAQQGNSRAMYMLGLYYTNGLGTRIDYPEALKWYTRAAMAGLAVAQNNLGYMYFNGYGAPEDMVQAYVWFDLASITLEREDLRTVAAENRDLAAARLSPYEMNKARELSANWQAEHLQN